MLLPLRDMSSCSIARSSSSSLFLLLIFLYNSSSSATNDLFSDVCSDDQSSAFCFDVLNSIPGASTAENLETLDMATFTRATTVGEDTYKYLDSLIQTTLDPQLRSDYNSCRENYEQVVGVLNDARLKWESKEYEFVVVEMGGAEAEINYCDYSFKTVPSPGKAPVIEPPKIAKKNKYFGMLCHIVYLIANQVQYS